MISFVCMQALLKLKVCILPYWKTRIVVCVVNRGFHLCRGWTSGGRGQIRIWFMCFLSPWQVNKTGANENKEVLSDFSGKKKTKKNLAALWCPLDIFVNTFYLPTWSTDYCNKINLSIYQKADRAQSKYYHKLNNIWQWGLCHQSLRWGREQWFI